MADRVLVIGGGASGMVAAIAAARQHADVTILEHNDRLGKKLLSTGNGRCNMTNYHMEKACFRGEDPSVAMEVIRRFPVEDTLQFFHQLGLVTKDKQGYVYPYSEQAASVLDVLCMEIQTLGIHVVYGCHVQNIKKGHKGFQIRTDQRAYEADKVILAAGSKAAPSTGSDGSGYDLAVSMGHSVITPLPALVQLRCSGKHFHQLAGIRAQARVTLESEHQVLADDMGEVQLTAYGISGIPTFQVSRYAVKALHENKKVFAMLDFLPLMEEEEFQHMMQERRNFWRDRNAADFLTGTIHKKLAGVLLKIAGIAPELPVREIPDRKFDKLCDLIRHFAAEVTSSNSYDQAQICCGGIPSSELDPASLESRLVKGFYITGELVDVDGICGGYNLQWAWSSGYLAGTHAGRME